MRKLEDPVRPFSVSITEEHPGPVPGITKIETVYKLGISFETFTRSFRVYINHVSFSIEKTTYFRGPEKKKNGFWERFFSPAQPRKFKKEVWNFLAPPGLPNGGEYVFPGGYLQNIKAQMRHELIVPDDDILKKLFEGLGQELAKTEKEAEKTKTALGIMQTP